MPEVKKRRKKKGEWQKKHQKLLRTGEKQKEKVTKAGLASLKQFFNDYHVEIKRTIKIVNERR